MKNLLTKLLSAQSKIGAIAKDSENPFFKSSYMSINALLDELKPVLNEVGLVVLQPLTNQDGKLAMKTIVADPASGEMMEFTFPLLESPDSQKQGSAQTYARRYSLQSLFLLQSLDDDGESAKPQTAKPAANSYQTSDKTGATVTKYRITCQSCGMESDSKIPNGKLCYSCWKATQ